jgi:hypothetical protein
MIKALKKLNIRLISPHNMTDISNPMANGKKTENISNKLRNGTRVSTITTLIEYSAGILHQSNKARERNI